MKFADICKLVKKQDGTRPKESSVRECVKNFKLKRNPVGRPSGSRTILERQRLSAGRSRTSPRAHACTHSHTRALRHIWGNISHSRAPCEQHS